MDLEKRIKDIELDLVNLCIEISNRCGFETNKVGFEFVYDEILMRNKLMFCMLAPCGCCRDLPLVEFTTEEEVVSKLKKINEIDTIIRDKIEEYFISYPIDLSYVNDWNKSSNEIAYKFIKDYYNKNNN